MSKLVFGCGYLGRRVAESWSAAGEEVFVVTRSSERARGFEKEGYQPIVADVTRGASLTQLPSADTVLYSIGFDRSAGLSMHDVFVAGLKTVLDALPAETGKFIYVSSTGVYGQTKGEWVDEDSPCQPEREGGRACLQAEQALAAHALGSHAVVLRMAGLYGPGRIPNAAAIRQNEPIASAERGFLNLIHVEDAAALVIAAAERATPPRMFVVSDGCPVERREYFAELARLLNADPPRFSPPAADSPAAARSASDKRVKNALLLAELRPHLRYPSYREGLRAIVAAEAPQEAND